METIPTPNVFQNEFIHGDKNINVRLNTIFDDDDAITGGLNSIFDTTEEEDNLNEKLDETPKNIIDKNKNI